MRINPGDVYSIQLTKDFGFIQYIETDDLGIELVRVLEPIKPIDTISLVEVGQQERWCTGFPLKPAIRKKIVKYVSTFDIPESFQTPIIMRSEYVIRGEHLGWHIVDRKTLKRKHVTKLSNEEIRLSPHGIMNDSLIIERLEENWRIDDWK